MNSCVGSILVSFQNIVFRSKLLINCNFKTSNLQCSEMGWCLLQCKHTSNQMLHIRVVSNHIYMVDAKAFPNTSYETHLAQKRNPIFMTLKGKKRKPIFVTLKGKKLGVRQIICMCCQMKMYTGSY